jgi:hypothetical protein
VLDSDSLDNSITVVILSVMYVIDIAWGVAHGRRESN